MSMNKNKVSKIFPIILVILVVVFVIFVLVSIGRAIFGSDDDGNKQTTSQVSARDLLLSTTADRSVTMTVRGQIVANEDFRSYQVTISPSVRKMVVYKGYLSEAIDTINLDNNVPAYEEFVYALDKAALGQTKAFTGEADNVRGICATGSVTEFDVNKNGESEYHVWTSTCSGSKGSLGANEPQLRSLFLKQIPNYQELADKVSLGKQQGSLFIAP